jgi:pyruvate ferredoxin oxidoreductase delta subunit
MSSARTYRPKAKGEGCKLCQMCRYMCPDLAITKDEKAKAMKIDLEYCKGCGICAAFCPEKVIEMVRENSQEEGTGGKGEG